MNPGINISPYKNNYKTGKRPEYGHFKPSQNISANISTPTRPLISLYRNNYLYGSKLNKVSFAGNALPDDIRTKIEEAAYEGQSIPILVPHILESLQGKPLTRESFDDLAIDISNAYDLKEKAIRFFIFREISESHPGLITPGLREYAKNSIKVPLLAAMIEPGSINTEESKIPGIPVTRRVIKHGDTPLITVSTYDKEFIEEEGLKKLLSDPAYTVKTLPRILERLTAQRDIIQENYVEAPSYPQNGIKAQFFHQNSKNLDGLADLEQTIKLRKFIGQDDAGSLLDIPLNLFPLPTSFRRAVLIPSENNGNNDSFYEFKIPGLDKGRLGGKRHVREGDFYAAVGLWENGIAEDYLYKPIALITLHDIEENPLLLYGKNVFSPLPIGTDKKIDDLNILVYKRPDGIRLSEMFAGVDYQNDVRKYNLNFIGQNFKGENISDVLGTCASSLYRVYGTLNGSICIGQDDIGNYILAKDGSVRSVCDFDRLVDTNRPHCYSLKNMLKSNSPHDFLRIEGSVKQFGINDPGGQRDYQKIFEESYFPAFERGQELRRKILS